MTIFDVKLNDLLIFDFILDVETQLAITFRYINVKKYHRICITLLMLESFDVYRMPPIELIPWML